MPVVEWLQDHLGGRSLQKVRECAQVSTKVARELVNTKAKLLVKGEGRRDILSLLGKLTVLTLEHSC